MKKVGGSLEFSATDLVGYLNCRRRRAGKKRALQLPSSSDLSDNGSAYIAKACRNGEIVRVLFAIEPAGVGASIRDVAPCWTEKVSGTFGREFGNGGAVQELKLLSNGHSD